LAGYLSPGAHPALKLNPTMTAAEVSLVIASR
jgi:hypothetical protein